MLLSKAVEGLKKGGIYRYQENWELLELMNASLPTKSIDWLSRLFLRRLSIGSVLIWID